MGPLLRRSANAIGVLLFAALFAVFVVQITARFIFQAPLPWTDEAALVLYLWSILWGAAFICREREHVAFDLLYQMMPLPARRLMALLASLLVGGLLAWALPATFDYISFMRRESSAVLGLPFHWVFAPFALMLLALVLRTLWRLAGLLGADWKKLL
ncbi:MAG: TRAP transporter small permease [Hylemonella sp.]